MKNQNDPTAQYYDYVYQGIKGADVVEEEIKLIESLTEPNARILDLACGTGRHTIPLLEKGYKVTAIDSSEVMVGELKKKLGKGYRRLETGDWRLEKEEKGKPVSYYLLPTTSSLELINDDFNTHDFGTEQFDLVIMMWNVFNEIVLTEEQAKQFLTKCKSLLAESKGGVRSKILINIDDAYFIDPAHFSHKQWVRTKDRAYESIWTVRSYDQQTNTTVSEEIINEFDARDRLINTARTEITQRWWKFEEIKKFCEELDLSVEVKRINLNEELYLVLQKSLKD